MSSSVWSSGTVGIHPSSTRRRLGSPSSNGTSLRTEARRIHVHANGHARPRDELVQHIPNGHGPSRADVVGTPGLAPFRDRAVRPNGVTNIREVAARVEVPDTYFGRLESGLDRRDLSSESGGREGGILSGTEVVERPRDHDLHARRGGVASKQFLRQLADAVRACRDERMVFGERLARRPVDERRAGNEHSRFGASPAETVQHVVRPADVERKRRQSTLPRPADVGRTGAVVHDGRAQSRNGGR